jgi:cobalt-zinc-cadmium efflux system outer membrane protein
VKTLRILFSCILFLSISSGIPLAEEREYGLQELIEIAFDKNPSAAIFRANIEASRGEVLSSKAYPNPEMDLETGRGRSLDGSESGGEYSVSIGQPIERPRKRLNRIKAAEKEVEAAEKEAEDFRLELVSEVKEGFYRLLLSKKEEEIASENLKIAEELFKTIKIRVEVGEAPEFELVKAEVERLKAEKELKRAKNRIAIAKTSLNALLGGALKPDYDITGAFSIPEKRYTRDALLSLALERHPLVLKAQKELEAKGYSLDKEKASVFPDITVKGFFGREIDKELYGVGLSVPFPLWYQKKGEIATASAERSKAEAELVKTKVELSKAITEEFQNYVIALDQLEVFEKGLLKQASEALRIAELSYRHGESVLLDYLDAQRVYRQTMLEYNQAFYELEVAVASLERAVGMGNIPSPPAPLPVGEGGRRPGEGVVESGLSPIENSGGR